MVLENLFIFALPPVLAIFLVSLAITLFVTLIYKYTTNQKHMKSLKDEQKRLQAEYKKHMKHPDKAMKIQKELMAKNMEYTKHSFRSTLYTFIPLIILFAWMNAHFMYHNLEPNTPFNTTAMFTEDATGTITLEPSKGLTLLSNATQPVNESVVWALEGPEGRYTLTYQYGNEIYSLDVLVTEDWTYATPVLGKSSGSFLGISNSDQPTIAKESSLDRLEVNLDKTHPFGGFSLFGWHPGWLATYIIFSLALSILLRKLLRVY